MNITGSIVINVAASTQVFLLPGTEGTAHVHVVGPNAARVSLLPSAKAKVSEEKTVIQKTTLQLPIGDNRFISARAIPPDALTSHTKIVISIGDDITAG